ncbi:MAG: hypothetical protein EOO61_18930 [Hymenobacter sp.]|nr:MAG: hypothetical protein EOO61_18930 [Hymenobacter sp.]
MENIAEKVDKKWFWVLIVTLMACFLLLSLTFDVFVEYQIVSFLLLLLTCLLLLISSIAAIRLSNSVKQLPSKALVAIIASIFVVTSVLYCYHHGAFYGRKIIDATFLDDRSNMHLNLYADGHYIITSDWMFGSEDFSGSYSTSENYIIFDEYSPTSKFIPKYLLHKGNKIYFYDKQAQLRDTSFYYFKINESGK